MRRATVLVTVLALVALAALGWLTYMGLAPGGSSAAPAATSSLTCSVKGSCDVGEVAVFRMSATANAHAGMPGVSTYDNVVCCGGVDGLGTNCTDTYATVLALSGTDNAHVATTTGGAYSTEVCLSVTERAVACTYTSDDCATGYECLATMSGDTNAHVADCDDVDDYATKVCCSATLSMPVGGMAELPDAPDSSGRNYMALAGLAAAALVALSAGAWHARRRWLG